MIKENEVREKMASVLARKISIVDLARWIMSNSWNMHRDSSPEAVSLVSEIHLLLAERDDLSLDDAAFLRELIALSSKVVVSTSIDIDERAADVNPMRYSASYSERWVPLVVRPVSA